MRKQLKPKEKAFLHEYLENGNNASEAARTVLGPAPMTETSNVRGVQGHRMLKVVKESNLLEKYLPDDKLFKKHQELLDKTDDGDIDTQAVSKALDMAYKLKGNYAPEKKELSGSIEMIPDERLSALADQLDGLS